MPPSIPCLPKFPTIVPSTPSSSLDSSSQTLSPLPPSPIVPQPSSSEHLIPISSIHIDLPINLELPAIAVPPLRSLKPTPLNSYTMITKAKDEIFKPKVYAAKL